VSSDLRALLQSSLGAGYRLSHELGGGGMAKVYVADDPVSGRRVVVKILSPELAAGVDVERFKREINLLARLHHANIVPVLSAGQSGDELLYYTMPFIDGEPLRALITRERTLPLGRALAIAHDIADALRCAHDENIVHRDIKPENVLIERATGRALVADFGIARAIARADGARVTSSGVTLGTPSYMSPEQAGAEGEIDGRSDIYSLGCVLFEMLTGAPPFTGPNARIIIMRHLGEAPPSACSARPELDESVDRLLSWMLAKDPAQRFANATKLLAALENPSSVPPPPREALHRVRQAMHALGTMLERVVHPSTR
jgi:eukaryotic-like serine/threonine-protein kinase